MVHRGAAGIHGHLSLLIGNELLHLSGERVVADAFFADCGDLNIKTPDVVEPATNCISAFIHMIEGLMEKGFAYESGGNIYFDTSKLKEYYVLSNHSEEELLVGVREDVDEDENKRNKTDFAKKASV